MQELIREFLEFHGLEETLAVMTPEAGMGEQPMSREVRVFTHWVERN